jgi:hypothetical protein
MDEISPFANALLKRVARLELREEQFRSIVGEIFATLEINMKKGDIILRNQECKENYEIILQAWKRQVKVLDDEKNDYVGFQSYINETVNPKREMAGLKKISPEEAITCYNIIAEFTENWAKPFA